jgi:dihydroorotase-like cyclic amidohydrolase
MPNFGEMPNATGLSLETPEAEAERLRKGRENEPGNGEVAENIVQAERELQGNLGELSVTLKSMEDSRDNNYDWDKCYKAFEKAKDRINTFLSVGAGGALLTSIGAIAAGERASQLGQAGIANMDLVAAQRWVEIAQNMAHGSVAAVLLVMAGATLAYKYNERKLTQGKV